MNITSLECSYDGHRSQRIGRQSIRAGRLDHADADKSGTTERVCSRRERRIQRSPEYRRCWNYKDYLRRIGSGATAGEDDEWNKRRKLLQEALELDNVDDDDGASECEKSDENNDDDE